MAEDEDGDPEKVRQFVNVVDSSVTVTWKLR